MSQEQEIIVRLKELHDEIEYQMLFNFPSRGRLEEEMKRAKECLKAMGYSEYK